MNRGQNITFASSSLQVAPFQGMIDQTFGANFPKEPQGKACGRKYCKPSNNCQLSPPAQNLATISQEVEGTPCVLDTPRDPTHLRRRARIQQRIRQLFCTLVHLNPYSIVLEVCYHIRNGFEGRRHRRRAIRPRDSEVSLGSAQVLSRCGNRGGTVREGE